MHHLNVQGFQLIARNRCIKHDVLHALHYGRDFSEAAVAEQDLTKFYSIKTEHAHEYLFYTERRGIRTPMSDNNVRKLLRSYMDSARSNGPSMPNNLHPHHFRHSRAMHLYQYGMELALVSQWLGHANWERTLIYAHADTEMKRKAIEVRFSPRLLLFLHLRSMLTVGVDY